MTSVLFFACGGGCCSVSFISSIPLTFDYDSQDMVLCRRLRGLEHRIAQEGEKEGLKCQVKYWAGAWEVEEIFTQLST